MDKVFTLQILITKKKYWIYCGVSDQGIKNCCKIRKLNVYNNSKIKILIELLFLSYKTSLQVLYFPFLDNFILKE